MCSLGRRARKARAELGPDGNPKELDFTVRNPMLSLVGLRIGKVWVTAPAPSRACCVTPPVCLVSLNYNICKVRHLVIKYC